MYFAGWLVLFLLKFYFGMPTYVSFQTHGCHTIKYNNNNNDYIFVILNISYHNI